jgi:hypothetical protein
MTSASKGLVVMACVGLVGLLISLAAHVSALERRADELQDEWKRTRALILDARLPPKDGPAAPTPVVMMK